MSVTEKTIAFIGGGHITEIIIENLLKAQAVSTENVIVSDPDQKRCELLENKFSVSTTNDNIKAAREGEILFINVRPQIVDEVLEDFRNASLQPGKILVTLAAGIPMEKYQQLGQNLAIVRALPNPPSQIGKGIIVISFNRFVLDIQQKKILQLFDSMGEVVILEEEHINTAMALSSPSSILLFFESLIDAGVRKGLDRDTAIKIAYQTIVGVMEVWKKRQVSPEELLKEACTPGGISVESVAALEGADFQEAIYKAIHNATLKAEQFGKKE